MSSEEKNTKKEVIRLKKLERQSEAKIVRKIVLIITMIILLIGLGIVGGGYFYIQSALKPLDPSNKSIKKVDIPIGSSTSSIAQVLEEKGIIKDARVFKYYIKFKNESGFQAGEYEMTPSMTIQQIIESLKTGKVMQKPVMTITIPEGKQLSEIATIIAKKTNQSQKEVLDRLNNREFIELLMKQYPDLLTADILNQKVKHPLEGYLFPATYPIYKKAPTVDEIVNTMLNKTKEVVQNYQPKMQQQKMSIHKLLTMASLIEEEATKKVDRKKISSVFYNRLDKDMLLQTDPTVLYAKGEHKEKVLYADLEIDSPYNTYKYKGLPPGPIANAGTTSIEAALSPEKTDYYYFLATSKGDVIFTKTLDEHNKEKAKHIGGD